MVLGLSSEDIDSPQYLLADVFRVLPLFWSRLCEQRSNDCRSEDRGSSDRYERERIVVLCHGLSIHGSRINLSLRHG